MDNEVVESHTYDDVDNEASDTELSDRQEADSYMQAHLVKEVAHDTGYAMPTELNFSFSSKDSTFSGQNLKGSS